MSNSSKCALVYLSFVYLRWHSKLSAVCVIIKGVNTLNESDAAKCSSLLCGRRTNRMDQWRTWSSAGRSHLDMFILCRNRWKLLALYQGHSFSSRPCSLFNSLWIGFIRGLGRCRQKQQSLGLKQTFLQYKICISVNSGDLSVKDNKAFWVWTFRLESLL